MICSLLRALLQYHCVCAMLYILIYAAMMSDFLFQHSREVIYTVIHFIAC
jgi:hypothetical protein